MPKYVNNSGALRLVKLPDGDEIAVHPGQSVICAGVPGPGFSLAKDQPPSIPVRPVLPSTEAVVPPVAPIADEPVIETAVHEERTTDEDPVTEPPRPARRRS